MEGTGRSAGETGRSTQVNGSLGGTGEGGALERTGSRVKRGLGKSIGSLGNTGGHWRTRSPGVSTEAGALRMTTSSNCPTWRPSTAPASPR